ncbi:autotransporter outer membrane beta-barrel domain-containing protein [Entomomonas asaccharolytica]|uniref:Autotransporter outer membrane beta-barrel domain-containing protein n=1 Tax=Entomomonas asaccharolytica TaxID=2785331 RepID=A0A974NH85_9GAMM|nr:autotransporter outer membrane beta-barrel domain-containing protein [Entomomonas asaccharolytica]QQP86517.1 autotransporter outer membrane beta-barrel domain-containing protein [Entomomonas asaccharolytica]
MSYTKFVKIPTGTLLYPLLLLAIANPAFARKANQILQDEIVTHPGVYAFNHDYINATVQNGGQLVLLPGCSNSNCDPNSDDYYYATAEGVTVTGTDSQLRVGGTANNTTVENGGTVLVGQAGFGALVDDSMRWDTFPAELTNTTIKNGGIEKVLAGGVSTGSTIETGGKQYVYLETGDLHANDTKAGTAINAIINGGQQNVYGTGAKAIGSIINNGGSQYIYNANYATQNGGGYAENTIINNGMQSVYGIGSQAHNTTINTQGVQYVYGNGLVTDTTINGGLQRIYSNSTGVGEAKNTTLNSGSQYVYSNGIATDTIVNGGIQQIFSAGIANNTTVNNGGTQKVQNANSIATDNIINNGGLQQVWDNGQAINNTINTGAAQVVNNAGIIKDTTVNGGYTSIYDGGISQGALDITNQGMLAIQTSASQTSNIANATIDSQSDLTLIVNSALSGTGNSFVNITNLENNGVASFSGIQLGSNIPVNSFDPITLNVDNLKGNGVYAMQADIGNQIGDLIKVNQLDANSNNLLFIANNGASTAQVTDKLTVVETTSGGNANQFSLYRTVEQGGYEFGLRQEGNNWVLCADANCARGPVPPGGIGSLTTTAQAAANFMNTSYLVSYINTQNLMQRMGDLRNTEQTKDVDIWMRGFAGKLNSFDGNLGGFDMNYRGTQIGADKIINLSAGALRVGVAAGYTDANPNYRAGNGGVRSYNFGLYGTYTTENNFYVDTLLKYDHIKNNFSVKDTQNNKVSGHAKSNGYGFSVEAGKRFFMQNPNDGLYIEPQVQLSYMHQQGDTVRASNGLNIKLSDYDSTLGRVSTAVGYQVKNTANPINVYFKTGYVREFTGDNINYRLNNSKEKHSFKGNFWDNELGVSMTINKQHTIHADLNYANGNRFDKQQINVGYRYTF